MGEATTERLIGEGPVLLTLENHVAHLRLNRPQQSNGISIALLEAMHRAVMACHGDPRIRAGAVVRLDNLGPDFSGDYRVTSATHTIDTGGYRTTFEVRKEILP